MQQIQTAQVLPFAAATSLISDLADSLTFVAHSFADVLMLSCEYDNLNILIAYSKE